MLILEYKIAELFIELEKLAQSLKKTLESDKIDYDEAILKLDLLNNKFSELERLLPKLNTDRIDAFHRHISFIRRYILNQNLSQGNLEDIIQSDIPGIKDAYYVHLKTFPYLDSVLKEECESLLANAEYDSAIRKAFLIMKDRAVSKYNAPVNLDGEALVNYLFAPDSGKIVVDQDRTKQVAFRNFCAGFFSFFRNTYAHNLVDNPEFAAESVLATINMILKIMDKNVPSTI